MTDNKTLTQQDTEMEQTTIRIAKDLKTRAQFVALEQGTTLQQLVLDGLTLRLAQIEKEKARQQARQAS